ncbi:MAG TPA: sigma-70 family RNA polymerase sigma factor, partial [Ignavibacteriaceae bacterium]|nr:sigma-70 family RNA polymerase sigma factor [Ignavibacteriaceae bacterium]
MTEPDNDYNLVERYNSGDESAFNEIARKYQQKIYWHARRMTGNHLDADEIVQEVLLVMYKKLKGFEFRSSLYTWIYTITSTRSINLLRRRTVKEIFSLED